MRPKVILGLIAMAALAPLASARNQAAKGRSAPPKEQTHPAAQSKQADKSNTLAVQSGTNVSAQLLTTLNAKKVKPGQRVVARVTRNVKQNGRTVIRKNSKLIGHVVSAQASGKGNAGSRLEVAFDRLVQGKSSTALSAVVTSIVSLPSAPMPEPMGVQPPMAPPMAGGGGGAARGGLLGGAAGAVGSTVGSAVGTTDATAGATAGATMGTTGNIASGAAGMAANAITVTNNASAAGNATAGASNSLTHAGLASSASASNQTSASSVFSRRNGNVDLDSGTQLQLQVVGSAQTQNPNSH
jgi:hypothetical protein